NFDTVRGGVDVASTDRATDGATNLAGFLNGLDAASQKDDPHLTALGHSYGSLTTGLALQEPGGAPVDDVVFYGSPGVEASSEADLGLEPGHVYAMEADDDRFVPEMGKTGRFGPDPSVIFPNLSVSDGVSPDGVHRDAAHGHSEYARPDAEGNSRMSGYNLAVVVAGLPDLVVR
ncbi:MAG: alpha/beta hydrolase, partial [Rhodococcus sp. (in: high G+C Gram-positive bacteria)]|uniref:alpha/beta hydrolase n=1 Tax=Rhodococcus sp. TaxID=1831 RepID=UPI003BB1FA92